MNLDKQDSFANLRAVWETAKSRLSDAHDQDSGSFWSESDFALYLLIDLDIAIGQVLDSPASSAVVHPFRTKGAARSL
jgi:hypothetical protein